MVTEEELTCKEDAGCWGVDDGVGGLDEAGVIGTTTKVEFDGEASEE